jgi:branched-chain amino acid transport system ATP-binding protein
MSALDVRDLAAGRSGVPVVRRLDLDVAEGEVVALLGPNGAGKTTVLETLGGVLPVIGGSVEVGGRPIRSVRDAARLGVSYLREGRGLFSQLTVHDNVRLRTRSRGSADALLRRDELLGPLADRRVGLLSGGEQQLLALACALAVRPRLLLIDEMTMGLAPVVVTELLATVRAAAADGVAVLFVEQHVHAALELADRALVLRRGEVVLQGACDDLSQRLDELHDSYFDLASGAAS